MRLLRTLARLALFQAESEPDAPFIATESATPAIGWIRCHLLASHDYGVRCAPGRIYLECRHCGTHSRGWDFGGVRYRRTCAPRLPALAGAAAVSAPAATRFDHEPAVPARGAAAAGRPARARARTPGGFSRLWRAPRPGRPLTDDRRWTSATTFGPVAAAIDAYAVGATTRARVHAARDPPGVSRL